MDPNATLAIMLQLANRIINNVVTPEDVDELAEKVLQLDEWLASGGFKPERWQ